MSLARGQFTTPYQVTRPTPFQHLSALTPSGQPNDDGVLSAGDVVWTHGSLPRVQGHRTALCYTDDAGEILVEVHALRRRGDSPGVES